MNHSERSSDLRPAAAAAVNGDGAAGYPLTRLQSLLMTVADLTDFLTGLTKLSAELVPGVACGSPPDATGSR